MNQNEVKRLTGLAMYVENENFYGLIKTPEFRAYLLENSDFITNMLIESFRVSSSVAHGALTTNGPGHFVPDATLTQSPMAIIKESAPLTLNQSVSVAMAEPRPSSSTATATATATAFTAPAATSTLAATLNSFADPTKENDSPTSQSLTKVKGLSLNMIENEVLEIVCAQTGYPKDMVELEIDLEADLGVDTVKKMEIIAELAEKYKLQYRKDFNMAHLSTVKKMANLIYEDSQLPHVRN